jgi:hypothetical protein
MNSYDSYIEVNYNKRQIKIINFKIYYWKGPTAVCDSVTPKLNMSGIEFAVKTVSADKYSLEVCTPSPTEHNIKFNLTELDRYTIKMGYLRIHDVRRDVKIFVRVQGAG